ncbi:MAG: hypothetical protein NTV39_02265 [Candidatus Saccharibacteria bacterium]|nr:hypothetical protein [Candidatus Saccharibacteria bacterium]
MLKEKISKIIYMLAPPLAAVFGFLALILLILPEKGSQSDYNGFPGIAWWQGIIVGVYVISSVIVIYNKDTSYRELKSENSYLTKKLENFEKDNTKKE